MGGGVLRSAPAIPLFGDAYLADTRHLSLEEHGAYLQLLMIAWRIEGCRLPDDDARLARMLGITGAKWRKLKPTVMAFWDLENGFWKQRRLSKERQFVEEKSAKNSASAKARWDSQHAENKQSDGCERISERNAPPPPPSSTSVEEKDEATPHSARTPPQPIAAAIEFFNENAVLAGWPTITAANEARRRGLGARLREHGLDGWKAAVTRARTSPYLGHDPPSWFTFDWLIKPTNFLKVIEGNYDRDRSDNSPQRGSAWGAARDALRVQPERVAVPLLEQPGGFGRAANGRS